MSFVLMDTTGTPSSSVGEMDDEDKEVEKKDKAVGLETPLTLRNEEHPSPPRNSVESTTGIGSSDFPVSTSTQDQDQVTRRKTRSMALESEETRQKGNENCAEKVVKKKKRMRTSDSDRDHCDDNDKDNHLTSNAEAEDHPLSPPTGDDKESKSRVTCKDCGYEFSSSKTLLRHIRRKHSVSFEEEKYECKICKTKFLFPSELRIHSRTHKGDIDKLMKCPDCGIGFNCGKALSLHRRHVHNHNSEKFIPNVVLYDDHISIIKGASTVLYRCKICRSGFRSKNTIRFHQSCRQNERESKRFTCKTCEKTFAFRKSLLSHMTIHGGEQFLCEVCKMQFTHHTNLKRHMSCHRGDKLTKCSECEAGFNNRRSLIFHLRFHKENDDCQSFKCQICGEESMNESYFCDHLFSHTANSSPTTPNPQNADSDTSTPAIPTKLKSGDHVIIMYDHISIIQDDPVKYQCNFCKAKFRGKSRIINHKLCPNGVKLPTCKECGEVFSRKYDLTIHLLRSHSIGTMPVVCELCNAQFLSSWNLSLHKKCHSKIPGKRRLKCHICRVKFNSKRSLTSHLHRHEAEAKFTPERFQCQICATSFALRHDRNQHIRLTHQPKVRLTRVDPTDMDTDYPVLSDNTTIIIQGKDTATTAPNHLDNPTLSQQNLEADIVTPSSFPLSSKVVEHHPMEVPEWNRLLPASNTTRKGDRVRVSSIQQLQQQQMIPPVKKPEPERLHHATVFVVALPMPVIYLPTNEVFLIDQNFEWKNLPDSDMRKNVVKMQRTTFGLKTEVRDSQFSTPL